jgi:hypothetical protein
MNPRTRLSAICFSVFFILGLGGCSFGGHQNAEERRQQDEKTRAEAAKATERAKPEIEAAGRALGRAAEAAAEDAHAAAQGIHEGWKQRGRQPLDLNSASESELKDLPGLSQREVRRIVRDRPYHDKRELVTRGILSDDAYATIRDDITTK